MFMTIRWGRNICNLIDPAIRLSRHQPHLEFSALSLNSFPHINIRMAANHSLGTMHPEFREVLAPKKYEKTGPTVFLSGSIDAPPATWQRTLTASLCHLAVTVLNPHRPDWDSTWKEDSSFAPWVEQVKWELDGMEAADVMAVGVFLRA
jgi:hypothetical protein